MAESMVKGIERLKKLNWIKNMGEEYLSVWTGLVQKYGEQLNRSPIIKKVAYTNHDFNHHCKDIYVIIENIFLKSVSIEAEESFTLAVAVLMHDISMIKENFDRLCHSQQSADFIQSEIDNGIREWTDVSTHLVPIIQNIVRAHSDIKKKDDGGKECIAFRTLKEVPIVKKGEYGGEIHVRWLAGILRLADELDVTQERSGTAETRYRNLNVADNGENKSRECWEKLNYFSDVSRDKTDIVLELNAAYLKAHVNDDRRNVIAQIKEVRETISKKLTEVNQLAFDCDSKYCNHIKLINVNILDQEGIFEISELDSDLGREELPDDPEEGAIVLKNPAKSKHELVQGSDTDIGVPIEKNNIQNQANEKKALRTELSKEIAEFIYVHDLICYGHYRLNRLYCMKDWINVRAILSEPKIGRECIHIIRDDLEMVLKNNSIEKVLLVGIGVNGSIMASRVAFDLELPFSYVVPENPGIGGSEMEKNFQLGDHSKVVLFTGVISSMDTLHLIIQKYLKNVEIVRIYTILRRKLPVNATAGDYSELEKKIIFLNGDFQSEIIPASQCMNAIYGECIAKNKQAYSEVHEWPLAVSDPVNERVFINSVIGCQCSCQYCYLPEIGIQERLFFTFEEVKAEFERLHEIDPHKYIISMGCYAECMVEENMECMAQLMKYFAEKGFNIQISTKKFIDPKWLKRVEHMLVKENQLNIYISIPTVRQAEEIEPHADSVEERKKNFEYSNLSKKIKLYLYIKPYLEGKTNLDMDSYVEIVNRYKVDVIVGGIFQGETWESMPIKVGKWDMYESLSDEKEMFIKELKTRGKSEVYHHSTEPIRLLLAD